MRNVVSPRFHGPMGCEASLHQCMQIETKRARVRDRLWGLASKANDTKIILFPSVRRMRRVQGIREEKRERERICVYTMYVFSVVPPDDTRNAELYAHLQQTRAGHKHHPVVLWYYPVSSWLYTVHSISLSLSLSGVVT